LTISYYLYLFISIVIMIVGVLIGVAFIILLERKVLGYIQLRKGPNRVGLMGIIQSFSDAIKLFIKEFIFSYKSNFYLFFFSPVALLSISLVLWGLGGSNYVGFNSILGILFFLVITSLGVYLVFTRGWSSNSNYALVGSVRGVSQSVSYEVRIALMLLSLVYFIGSYRLFCFRLASNIILLIYLYVPIFLCWCITILAETNRPPFDFAEGESELVSGFNVDYSRGGFAFLFLAEYAIILFMSYFIRVLFFGGLVVSLVVLLGCLFSFCFIWVRGCLPRFRYDKLIYLAWKIFLPVVLLFLCFYIGWPLIF